VEVVNESGGPGGGGTWQKWPAQGITVAGKTGSAQATDRGKKDTICLVLLLAPFEKPRRTRFA